MSLTFNHMEITFPLGALTEELRLDLEAFYGDVFGFTVTAGEMFDQKTLLMKLDSGLFILLIEGVHPLASGGFDHLGFEQDSREDVDETLAKVKGWQQKDDRVHLREYPDGAWEGWLFHAYYVKHLLPIWFDVQHRGRVTE